MMYGNAWGRGFGPGGFHGGGLFGLISGLILLAVIVIAAVLIIRALRQGGGIAAFRHESSALQILNERYARGEIDTQEYDEKRRVLMGTSRTERSVKPEPPDRLEPREQS